jgi:hypothetical protein
MHCIQVSEFARSIKFDALRHRLGAGVEASIEAYRARSIAIDYSRDRSKASGSRPSIDWISHGHGMGQLINCPIPNYNWDARKQNDGPSMQFNRLIKGCASVRFCNPNY